MNLWWHCRFCGDHAPAQPTYEHGDKEICIKCGEGVAVVMTTREAAQFESEIARGERQPERCYDALQSIECTRRGAPLHSLSDTKEYVRMHEDIEDDVDPEERKHAEICRRLADPDLQRELRRRTKKAADQLRDGTLTSKVRRVMDESERSRLLYLLDALRVAPQKAENLISVVAREDASEPFRKGFV